MASSEGSKSQTFFGDGFLYTPEEPFVDSFCKEQELSPPRKLAPIQTLSPPASPENGVLPCFSATLQFPTHDSPLYNHRTKSSTPHSQTPLFEIGDVDLSPAVRRSDSVSPLNRIASIRLSDITNLGTVVGPSVYIHPSPEGALDYYNTRMAELEHLVELRKDQGLLPKPSKSVASPRDPISAGQLARLGKPTGIIKNKPAMPTAPKPKATKAASPIKARTPIKRASQVRTVDDFHDVAFGHSAQPKHKRAAPSKKVEGKEDDSTWRQLPDYCPAIESLQQASKVLKTDWKRTPLDISQDIDVDCLAPAEYDIAVDLRIRPVQYLANKRRMFAAKVNCLREGKNFTKTAAQVACNIDVNKTSKMWEAFDRVGWFKESWFEKWLQSS